LSYQAITFTLRFVDDACQRSRTRPRGGASPVGQSLTKVAKSSHARAVAVYQGAALYVRDGFINRYGPNALGGVPNPPDKSIPPLSGIDFRKEFNTDAKIIAVIRSGSVIGRAPDRQHAALGGGVIPDDQLRALVAYLKTLK
jgi:hypothetical protein